MKNKERKEFQMKRKKRTEKRWRKWGGKMSGRKKKNRKSKKI